MIVSTVSGRIRIRSNILKAKKRALRIEETVKVYPGVNEVRTNPSAGSITVMYAPDEVDETELEAFIEQSCSQQKPHRSKTSDLARQVNRISKVGMISSLATSVALAYTGPKKLHIATGQAFVVFAGLHMLKHRKTLFR